METGLYLHSKLQQLLTLFIILHMEQHTSSRLNHLIHSDTVLHHQLYHCYAVHNQADLTNQRHRFQTLMLLSNGQHLPTKVLLLLVTKFGLEQRL